MREELERIQKIERLLNGQLAGQERVDFEQQIASDPGLQADVKAQQTVLSGLERLLLRPGIKKAAFRFKWMRWLLRGGAGLVGIGIVVTACLFLFSGNRPVYKGKSLPTLNESGKKQWAYADTAIAAQSFEVNGAKDTVIETKGGILLAVPAGCFLDKDGNRVTGKVEFVIKEALDAATIVKSGLSTTSDGKLLETGGMFFLDARHNGGALKIDPQKYIYAQVPTDSVKAGMQLFHGERMADGSINWANPKPIEHDLVPVDINTLNFYPPHFLKHLADWGYDTKNKHLTDSLYYSLAALFVVDHAQQTGTRIELDSVDTAKESLLVQVAKPYSDVTMSQSADCAINPAKIKAIWNDKFQNTLIATREFEERLQTIHFSVLAPHTLDVYLNNLDKPLYQIDSLAASQDLRGDREIFLKFAARHDGRVNITKKQLLQLKKYYQTKWKLYTLAAAKTQREFWGKQAELDAKADDRRARHGTDSSAAAERNFEQEFSINLKEACRQIGWKESNLNTLPPATYTVQIAVTGWCNIDRAVEASLATRETLDYTDGETGKKAVIKYSPVSFQIANADEYDKVLVYLIPDKLNSFINVARQNGQYVEKLNELIQYSLFCIGYKNGQQYIYTEKNIKAKAHPNIQLNVMPDEEVKLKLTALTDKKKAEKVNEENAYQQAELLEQKRIKANVSSLQLRNALVLIAFPCWIGVDVARPAAAPAATRDTAIRKPQQARSPTPVSEDQ